MLQRTQALVLRTVKYGETSLVVTAFTRIYGVQTFLVQGIRTAGKKGHSRAGLFQPATLLDLVIYHKPAGGMQRIREFTPAHIYRSIQETITKNSIALFSAEFLLRLLPPAAPAPELYDFCHSYFIHLDEAPDDAVGNFPLFFLLQCSRYMGYEIHGNYDAATPFLNLEEGSFTAEPPVLRGGLQPEDAPALAALSKVRRFTDIDEVNMNGAMRQRLLEWFLHFLQRHTDHMGPMKSLVVLQSVLHG